MALKYEIAIAAIVGSRRTQEDAARVAPLSTGSEAALPATTTSANQTGRNQTRMLAALADGMGGHTSGEVASRVACESFIAATSAAMTCAPASSPNASLSHGLHAANAAIALAAEQNPAFTGMGCTLVGALLDERGIQWISVGDSLLLLWRRGVLARLNEDHSLAPEIDRLVAAGVLTAAAARSDPRRHYLRSALTGEDIELIDAPAEAVQLGHGDIVVLASDGLETLSHASVADLLAAGIEAPAERLASRLVNAVDATEAANQDNTTVIVVLVKSD